MKTKSHLLQAGLWSGVLGMLVLPGQTRDESTLPTADGLPSKRAEAIAWSQLGARAGANYAGDGLAVSPRAMGSGAATGVRLRCLFQQLEGEATREGLWLTSTVTNASALSPSGEEDQSEVATNERFRVAAVAVG